jgi:hypothetical protein
MDWKGWIASAAGFWSATLHWLEAHQGTASWLEALGSIAAIIFVYLLGLSHGRRANSHQQTDRIRRAQALALLLIPVLIAFKPKLEVAIVRGSKLPPPDEVMHLLDQLYILGVAGGLILQMVATLQADERDEPAAIDNEGARSSYNRAKQRLNSALHYCEDAINALMTLARVRTV